MGKYLKRFDSESAYQTFESSGELVKPNVSVVGTIDTGSGAQGDITIDAVHYTAIYGSAYGG